MENALLTTAHGPTARCVLLGGLCCPDGGGRKAYLACACQTALPANACGCSAAAKCCARCAFPHVQAELRQREREWAAQQEARKREAARRQAQAAAAAQAKREEAQALQAQIVSAAFL